MCGIAGFWTRGGVDRDALATLRAMTDAIAYRGPDDDGHWLDQGAGVALGHRRLAILDLSPQGHQPMFSASGRFAIIFNGEVYNFEDIRKELGSREWRGHSDTEVMLAAVEQWGLEGALRRFIGMFAFALFDRQERVLHLVRDRLGIKPLYYGWSGDTFLFGSELKALRAHPRFQADIDRDALALFMRHNYIPSPYSIYRGISKLPPGTVLTLRAAEERSSPKAFWSAREVVEAATRDPFQGNEQEATDQLEALLRDAIRLRMVSDVPLGAFLSGGVDSSTVVALMQAQSSRPVKTFSIGFNEAGFNEAQHAATIAKHLGTDHTELYVTDAEARAVIPSLPAMFDEPFADSSQIPTYLVSKLAREQVTVSLSGDGGDELFGGYTRYLMGWQVWRLQSRCPVAARRLAAAVLHGVPVGAWDAGLSAVQKLFPHVLRQTSLGDKVHKAADILAIDSPEEMYRRLVSHWASTADLVPSSVEPPTSVSDPTDWAAVSSPVEKMMYVDLVSYLPGDILTKVDRASMAVSLEARVPLLDHRVANFAWRLPLHMKVRQQTGKWLLRQVLYRYVPPEMIERPKMGFGIPVGEWLRGPLREWAEDLLATQKLGEYLDCGLVHKKWQEHVSRRRNWQYSLWSVLMFQSWLAHGDTGTATQRRSSGTAALARG